MRDLFCARPGFVLAEADYSQLELRIVALLSRDEKLLQWYADGVDVHTVNAKSIFGTDKPKDQQRDLAKRVVYGLNYGGSAATIWKSLVVDFPGLKLEAVEHVVKRWFEEHPAIGAWQRAQIELAQRNGFVEESISGRRQYYHDGRIKPTEVLNYPIQGAAGTLANKAILSIDAAFDWADFHLLMQVHDSTVSELRLERLDEGIAIVKRCMEQEIVLNGVKIKFPVDVKVGTNWGHMEKRK
jgi:DNA polymerase-1